MPDRSSSAASRSTCEVERSRFTDLTVDQLYGILQLRSDVFVVEQHCPYPELDGRDAEPDTVHLWITEHDATIAYARLLTEPDGTRRIGRVVTRTDRRGRGLAGRLLTAALDLAGDAEVVLSAQAHLTDFYARYGFEVAGDEYLEDGIPHRPMRRPRRTTPPTAATPPAAATPTV